MKPENKRALILIVGFFVILNLGLLIVLNLTQIEAHLIQSDNFSLIDGIRSYKEIPQENIEVFL